MTLDMNGKLEIGLYDFSSKGSIFDFSSSGFTTAVLYISGKQACWKDEFIILPSSNFSFAFSKDQNGRLLLV